MQIETIVKVAYAIQATCAVSMVGIGIYSVKKQSELNRTIAEGTQQIVVNNAQMERFLKPIRP